MADFVCIIMVDRSGRLCVKHLWWIRVADFVCIIMVDKSGRLCVYNYGGKSGRRPCV